MNEKWIVISQIRGEIEAKIIQGRLETDGNSKDVAELLRQHGGME